MFPQPMSVLQPGQGSDPANSAGIPFGMPFGLLPPMTSSHVSMMGNHSDFGNLTTILASFSNMTAAEVARSLHSFLLASLMRQYMFNDFFAGGLGLMLIGLFGTQLQRFWSFVVGRLTSRKGTVQFRIAHDSEVFNWIQDWLKQFTRLSSTQYDVETDWEDTDNDDCGGGEPVDERPKVKFFPEFKSAQCIKYKRETIWIQTSSQFKPGGGGRGGGEEELLKLLKGQAKEDLLLSASNREILENIIQDAMDAFFKKEEESRVTKVFRWSCDEMYWVNVGARKARPVESIILDCDPKVLLDDARRFLSSEAWYRDRGIPHRRGYLLYGPPGCGKTSLIKVLAGELKLDVSLISLSSKDLSDDTLQNAMNRLPYRSVFVLEDVDAAFGSGGKDVTGGVQGSSSDDPGARMGFTKNSLSFSGLLNAIDGITAQEGRIVVMTTNHIEKLDSALIRPGRIDLRLYLGLASKKQASGIFRRFYPDATSEQEAELVNAVPADLLSPASLQGLFLEYRDDAVGMLAHINSFVAEMKGGGKKKAVTETGKNDTTGATEKLLELNEESVVHEKRSKKKDKRNKKRREQQRETDELVAEEMKEVVAEHRCVGNSGEDDAKVSRSVEGGSVAEISEKSCLTIDGDEGWETVTRGKKKYGCE